MIVFRIRTCPCSFRLYVLHNAGESIRRNVDKSTICISTSRYVRHARPRDEASGLNESFTRGKRENEVTWLNFSLVSLYDCHCNFLYEGFHLSERLCAAGGKVRRRMGERRRSDRTVYWRATRKDVRKRAAL